MSAKTRYVPTSAAYDGWAPTYDTDGNMLQNIDDLELEKLLPVFLSAVVRGFSSEEGEESRTHLKILDLGCGTGRNTKKVLEYPWGTCVKGNRRVIVYGLDFSEGMLAIARRKLGRWIDVVGDVPNCVVVRHDFVPHDGPAAAMDEDDDQKEDLGELEQEENTARAKVRSQDDPIMPSSEEKGMALPVHAVISTLVLEHFCSARLFFRAISKCLVPGGFALVTNMHEEMGEMGGAAGFVVRDGEGRKVEKVRGSSYLVSVGQTLEAARAEGLEVWGGQWEDYGDEDDRDLGLGEEWVKGWKERMVEKGMIETIGERARKWIGTMVWYGILFRKAQ